jgi:predicted phage terminase large subunit-like protein
MTNHIRLEIDVSPDNAASDRWSLVQGGEFYAVGCGAGISGFRADIATIDDPFGSREDAYSAQVRQKRWDWYLDDFSLRQKPNAKRIIMATRWHEDDLSGRILQQIEQKKNNPENYFELRHEVISIPAICESENDPLGRKPGEYLWDEEEDRKPDSWNYGRYLRSRQQESSPMMWSALFQQRPAPETGDYFKEEWLKPYKAQDIDKKELRVYGASDYAVTADGGDYTVHIVVGLDHTGKMYLIDLWRGQTSPEVWIEEFCRLVLKHAPLEWGEESGQIKSSIGPFLGRRQMETGANVYRRSFPTKSDKAIRAQSIRGRMATEGLYILESAPYYEKFRSELLGFPASKHDDMVDALSLIGQMIDHIIPAEAPPPPPEKPRYIKDITLDELWDNNHLTHYKHNQRI